MAESKPRRSPKAAAQAHAPWLPVPYELADASAIKALWAGEAEPSQQQRAMKWIVEQAAGIGGLAFYYPGEDGRRDTDFALGRAFVGNTLLKMRQVDLSLMRQRDNG